MREADTIAAIATPSGRGGVGIVRISGNGTIETLSKVFFCKTPAGRMADRKLYLGELRAERFSDQCLAVLFRAPNSYTGEDVAELHCHGGRRLTEGALRAVLDAGARCAVNGEFTKRAFLNGKLSLSAAEGVAELIDAESEAELAAAYALERGGLTMLAEELQNALTELLAELEAALDDPDTDADCGGIARRLAPVAERLAQAERDYSASRTLREGVAVAVVGAPNAGKSSLMNALLSYDRAIVSGEPGTTRDTLEAVMELGGIKFRLTDTAGIRAAESEVERQGVDRARRAVLESQLVLFVVDAAGGVTPEVRQAQEAVRGKRTVLVCNQSDRAGFDPAAFLKIPHETKCEVSAKMGAGIRELKTLLVQLAGAGLPENGIVLTNERQIGALRRARAAADAAAEACACATADAAALELKCAWDALGEITGTTATEEIVNAVFAKFCIGK